MGLFSDTFHNVVYRYSLSAGRIDGAAEKLVVGKPGEALIDSMCGLTDGSFYVMNPNPIGKISYYNADGSLNCDGHVSAPTSHFMASCAFSQVLQKCMFPQEGMVVEAADLMA